MASIRLNPPEPFDFKQPDQWEKWRRSFEQFRVASGLSSEKKTESLAENCNNGNLKHEMIRNRIVVGFETQPFQSAYSSTLLAGAQESCSTQLIPTSDPDCKALQEDVELYIECVTHHLPATERKLLEYQWHQAEDPEPMIVSQPPDYPWQKVGSDLFELNGQKYLLLVVDYFSRFLEVTKLSTTTSVAITHVLKTTFLRYGIPEVLITDNGTQHTSSEMKEFSNSPSELLMGRKLRTTLPQTTIHLMPEWPFLKEFKRQNKKFKDKQETQYNRAQRTRPLLPLEDGMDVWVSSGDRKIPGQVVAPSHTPSSYLVDNRGGIDTIL
eukprot:Em0005g878a